jgi:hypothetical protein
MSRREDRALRRLVAGGTFADVCEAFADLAPERGARDAAGLLLRWVEDGLVARAA